MTVKVDLTTGFVNQFNFPDNIKCLIPHLIGACQISITPITEKFISAFWKKKGSVNNRFASIYKKGRQAKKK